MSATKKTKVNVYVQYGFVGAALGLYYGIFFKPVGEPDIGITFTLGIFAGLVTVLVSSWKKGYSFKRIFIDFLIAFAFYQFFLLTLAFRYYANEWGGPILVIVTSTLAGVALGLMMAWQRFGRKTEEVEKEE